MMTGATPFMRPGSVSRRTVWITLRIANTRSPWDAFRKRSAERATGGEASDGRLETTRFALTTAFAASFATPAAAEYPDQQIRLIVPQAAGSATDTVSRILGAELAREIGQQVIVDNRPGGALTLGLDLTAKSAADGYTICMGPIGALAITRHMVAKLPYDIERDFQPIALVTRGICCSRSRRCCRSIRCSELIDYAKANPGKLSNASSSNGSPGHVGGELFKYMTGTDIVHVPYKGGAQAINDLIAGHVQLMFESLNSIASVRQVRHACVRSRVSGAAPLAGISRSADDRAKPACPVTRRRPGPASSRRPGMPRADRRQAQCGDQPCDQLQPSRSASRRSATSRPVARRRISPTRSAKDSAKWEEVIRRAGAKLD